MERLNLAVELIAIAGLGAILVFGWWASAIEKQLNIARQRRDLADDQMDELARRLDQVTKKASGGGE